MEPKEPIDRLEIFYASHAPECREDMFANVIARQTDKRKRLTGAALGFATAGVISLGLLLWASQPLKTGSESTANAITRYQMVHSGLAERSTSAGERSQ